MTTKPLLPHQAISSRGDTPSRELVEVIQRITKAVDSTATGLGTMAAQNANAVAITGGAVDGAAIGQTTPAAVKGTGFVSTGVITDGFSAKSAGTLALAFGSNGVAQVTPNATGTFTTTVPAAGTRCTLIIVTSGVTSYTMTFGTGFKTTGTLATGTATAKTFVLQFISDGTTVIEASRTAAM